MHEYAKFNIKLKMYRILALTNENGLFKDVEKTLLNDINVEVKSSSDIWDVLQNLQQKYTHLVILDIDVLFDDVKKLIDIIRAIQKDCKVILILSQQNMSICSSALTMGLVSYLIKPFSALNANKIIIATLLKDIMNKSSI